MKKSNFEEALASDMDAIMNDKNFEAIFKKASVLTKEASEEMCADDCKMDHDHKKEDKPESDTAKADDGTLTLEAAVSQALNNLRKVSEVLDEVGLEKTAALSLNLVNYIIVEAKKKDEAKKSDKKKADDKKKDDKSDKNDAKPKKGVNPFAKKDDKKDDKKDKKDDKKSDKSDSKKK